MTTLGPFCTPYLWSKVRPRLVNAILMKCGRVCFGRYDMRTTLGTFCKHAFGIEAVPAFANFKNVTQQRPTHASQAELGQCMGSGSIVRLLKQYEVVLWCATEKKLHGNRTEVWRQHSSQVRSSLNLARDRNPWTDGGALLHGVDRCERKLDLANVAWAARLQEHSNTMSSTAMAHIGWIDLDQSVLRRPWSARLRSARATSQLYSYEHDRCLTGQDAMRLHGWPPLTVRNNRQSDLLVLAAEGTSLPLVSVLVSVIWCNPHALWRAASVQSGAP